ncbi:MAG: ParB family transcriptional regulator, chromosome partitioning protein [Alphaproteobacteria bacterium]|nr:ParB family transcriptional regulator, chromosome partitioning protein [Alphaproteobacteria bacterium]
MSDEGRRQKLGRGLSALLGDERSPFGRAMPSRTPSQVPVGNLRPNIVQPRKRFDEASLRELADSIREKGILQPILVRPIAELAEHYEIIAGERRWRAAQLARLHEVPVLIRDISDTESLELALIENIQRADLNAMDEARGYARLIDEYDHSQEDVGRIVGKSRSHIANMLRLLALPESLQHMLEDGRLSAGHGRTLITASDPEALAQQIVTGRLSVRDAEALAKGRKPQGPKKQPPHKDPNIRALEEQLSNSLGLRVSIISNADESGAISVSYKTLEQFESICERLQARQPGAHGLRVTS